MRTYLIEDIADADFKKFVAAFDQLELNGPLEGIYYLPLPEEMLRQEQKDHLEECGPFFMALETVQTPHEEHHIRLELLVRARNKMRCSCVMYATPAQRKHMIDYLDKFIEELGIAV